MLHRRYAVCSPAHLTVASARTWRLHSKLLCSHRRVVPLGRERGQGRALRASPRPSPWNHQRHWSSSRSHQLVRISGNHLCRTRGSPQLDADRQQYAAASPPATHPHAALTVSSHSPRACRSSPRCACTLSWVCWGGRAGVSEAMHRIAASMMDGSRCGRGEFAAGDSQRSRRRGYGAARPRQETPIF